MSQKELRKQLELAIIKATETVLDNQNAKATQKIKKIIEESSKVVAKKFYKAVKKISVTPSVSEVKKTAAKVEKNVVTRLKIKTAPVKVKAKK
ncbi:MAG: hypothetical protein V4608_15660 [Bacteroidota bacterium]